MIPLICVLVKYDFTVITVIAIIPLIIVVTIIDVHVYVWSADRQETVRPHTIQSIMLFII